MRAIFSFVVLVALVGCGGAPPKMAGEKWAAALRDPDARVRKKAAFTLGNIGACDPAVCPALLAALKDDDAKVRCEAILGLLKTGYSTPEAISALTDVQQQDREARVRVYATKALEKLRPGH